MKTMAVIIPVVQPDLFDNLMTCISKNTQLPNKIIVINNSGKPLVVPYHFPTSPHPVEVMVLDQTHPLGVNASWRLGLRHASGYNLISILNDDLLLAYDFFEKIRKASNQYPKASAYCPNTVKNPKDIMMKFHEHEIECATMARREGWAFTIRGELLADIPVIPSALTMFFGDDWIYRWTAQILRRPWIKVKNALAFHYCGVSVGRDGTNVLLQKEKLIYQQLISDL